MRKADAATAAEMLHSVLEQIAAGELEASPGHVARLEGATAALEAIAGRRAAPVDGTPPTGADDA